jgi:hypothetical protein
MYFQNCYKYKCETTWKQQGNSLSFHLQHCDISAASGALWSLSKKNSISSVQKAWIKWAGPIQWPPITPVLTPCNFYLWEYVKDQVYQPPMPQSLWEPIGQTIANTGESQLQHTWKECEYHVDLCRVNNGTHFKYLC